MGPSPAPRDQVLNCELFRRERPAAPAAERSLRLYEPAKSPTPVFRCHCHGQSPRSGGHQAASCCFRSLNGFEGLPVQRAQPPDGGALQIRNSVGTWGHESPEAALLGPRSSFISAGEAGARGGPGLGCPPQRSRANELQTTCLSNVCRGGHAGKELRRVRCDGRRRRTGSAGRPAPGLGFPGRAGVRAVPHRWRPVHRTPAPRE